MQGQQKNTEQRRTFPQEGQGCAPTEQDPGLQGDLLHQHHWEMFSAKKRPAS